MYEYDITAGSDCQVNSLIDKLRPKREWAIKAAPWIAKHVSLSAQSKYEHCGDYMTVLADRTMTKRKIETAYFCGQRMCPGCAWRTSLRAAATIAAISTALEQDKRIMLMVTLTVPNVPGERLRAQCLDLGHAWDRLMRRKRYMQAWADNIRKLEITYNARADTYHPHMHVIVYVRPSYFASRAGKSTYISQQQLLADWREVTGDDSITQVDIRRCRDTETGSSAILEVAKYTAKASDYTLSEQVYDTYYRTLWHLRTMTYAGRCHALKAAYDAGELDVSNNRDTTEYVLRLIYRYYADQGYTQIDTQPYVPGPTKRQRIEQAHNDRVLAARQDIARAIDAITWHDIDGPEWASLLADEEAMP